MKINCECGCRIIDSTDGHSTKGHLIPDKDWNRFWDAIDDAIVKSGRTPKDKEKAAMDLRQMSLFRTMWQCPECGQLFIDDQNYELNIFNPTTDSTSKEILNRTEPSS